MSKRTYVPAVLAVLLIAILTLSANTKETRLSTGINPGDLAPGIESLESKYKLNFHNHSGRYTLLSFWAAYDAESRARNVSLSNVVNKLDPAKIAMYSISLDKNRAIFEETLKIDNLDETRHLWEGFDSRSALFKAYKLNKGLRTFLIDDTGKIVAVNVGPKELAEFMENS